MGDHRILEIVLRARDEASRVIERASGSIRNLEGDVKVIGGAMAGLGAITGALTTHVIRQAGAFEQYQVALTTILGDANKAEEHFQALKDFARTTPFNFEEIVKNNNLLLAMGASVDGVIDEMTMLGNIAAGLSVPIERVAFNFGQVRAQGQLTGVELRDFARAGIPLIAELAKQFGVTEGEVKDMVEAGEVGFKDVEKAFQSMTSEGGKFHNLMQEQSQTTLGRWSNFQDALQQTAASVGEILLPAVNRLLTAVIPIIERVAAWAREHETLTTVLVGAGLAIGAIGVALLTLFPIITTVTSLVSILGATFGGAITVIGGVVGVLGGPLTLAIAAIIAIIGVLAMAWNNNWFDIQGKVGAAVSFIGQLFNQLKGFINDLQNRFNSFRESVSQVASNIRETFSNMASGISNALRSIKFPHVKLGEGNITVAGREVKFPKLDVDWYEQGGFVPRTGLAMLHAGEFVLSKDMLSGRQDVPATVTTTNNSPINIGPIYVRDMGDIDGLTHKLGFMLRTGGRY